MKTVTNTVVNKRVFRIALYSTCPIYGILSFYKENKGYLTYYDDFGEITKDLDNYNEHIIKSIITQAEIICLIKNATLWNY